MTNSYSLTQLGWVPFFQQQLSLDELNETLPARVFEQHRNRLVCNTVRGPITVPVTVNTAPVTVGDWLLLNADDGLHRVLERKSCFRRRAAGPEAREQLMAANVDTAFILSSLNYDFNLNRIERYLALVHEAGAEPVVVLSKADLCDEPEAYHQQVQALDSLLCVESINALDAASVDKLRPWCKA
ncbi:MAG: GTPase RsgA, partial [Pseudomonadales bacterium]|nr:GTPase RsgA [Pseudomonadales bacterium]